MTAELALVTGAACRLGCETCERLQMLGFRVRALQHRRRPPVADEVAVGDITDVGAATAACAGVSVVVHLAAVTHARSAERYRRTNEHGTRTLVRAAVDADVGRFVLVSTRAISPAGGAYSATKLAAEQIVRDAEMPHVIIRLAEVLSADGREGVDRLVRLAASGRVVPVLAGAELAPIALGDAAAAISAAARSSRALGRTLTLAGESAAMEEVVRRAARVAGRTSRTVRVPWFAIQVLAQASRALPLGLVPDQPRRLRSAKAASTPGAWADLGVQPADLEGALRRAMEPQSAARTTMS